MKSIWIMRHAKSDWSHGDLSDFDRPLNKRGLHDAPAMGRWMGTLAKTPDLIVSSPAHRARKTAELVAQALPFSGELRFWEDLYPGNAASTITALRGTDERFHHILLIGHNPNMEGLVSTLAAGGSLRLRVPTAAVIMLVANIGSWAELSPDIGELHGMITPKLLRQDS